MPWTGKQQRRAILNKYNASHMSWGGGGFDRSRPEYFDELTVEQQNEGIGAAFTPLSAGGLLGGGGGSQVQALMSQRGGQLAVCRGVVVNKQSFVPIVSR